MINVLLLSARSIDKKIIIDFINDISILKLDIFIEDRKENLFVDEIKCNSVDINRINKYKFKLIYILGGDGTVLYYSNKIARSNTDAVIFPIHHGTFGFLTNRISRENILSITEMIILNKNNMGFYIYKYPILKAFINGKSITFINDFVIEKKYPNKSISTTIEINKERLYTIKSDGFIVSSSLGSTAYSLATDGPIVFPNADSLLIKPINAHLNQNHSFIIRRKDVEIDIMINSNIYNIYIHYDGILFKRAIKSNKITVQDTINSISMISVNKHIERVRTQILNPPIT